MSHSSAPEPDPAELSDDESKLVAQLRANPIFAARCQMLMNRFDEELADGKDAHQAEEMVIEELDQLGQSLMGQWAETAHENILTQSQSAHPDRIKSGKKTPVVHHLRNHPHRGTSPARGTTWRNLPALSR